MAIVTNSDTIQHNLGDGKTAREVIGSRSPGSLEHRSAAGMDQKENVQAADEIDLKSPNCTATDFRSFEESWLISAMVSCFGLHMPIPI
ncbi:hypothetical protein N7519_006184 [Penicillium mononematosum]|uniref:uncharacterized protein n=1 Tax=Penicillium mononematosum TaxID=268346 RepID=UPI002547BD47|nr:uncharacterized protein N7519_006184 [Penicillium mononematosum]KAJ6184883.1 hypothetical protein N7519_006184 [Penicillium mononematosum]